MVAPPNNNNLNLIPFSQTYNSVNGSVSAKSNFEIQQNQLVPRSHLSNIKIGTSSNLCADNLPPTTISLAWKVSPKYKNPFDYSKYATSSRNTNLLVETEKHFAPSSLDYNIWECLICSKKEKDKDSLLDHYEYHKEEKDKLLPFSPKQEPLENQEPQDFYCELCRRSYPNAYYLSVHNALHSTQADLYTCIICKEFTCKVTHVLQQHINSNHPKIASINTPTFCTVCKKQFSDTYNFEVHNKLIHLQKAKKVTEHECPTCKAIFATSKALSRHMCGEETTTCLCSVCGKKLKNEYSLKYHMELHSGTKRFMCTVCGKSFSKSDTFKCHMRTHSGEKPYKCTTCGKCFSQRTPLVIHQRSHTGERPYACKNCGKGYASRSAVNMHSRTCT